MQMIPRPEYPRPQYARPTWMNLNGTWQFEIDHGASGRARGMVEKEKLEGEILVPFCPESELSGVHNTDFMQSVWYRRAFTLPKDAEGKRVLLHFGAVDYKCEAWVNGQSVGVHEGGYVSFTFEITNALREGENTLVVCADDFMRMGRQPFGKQSDRYHSYGCSYTRTTGIWQTVWLEWVAPAYMKKARMVPDAMSGSLFLDVTVDGAAEGMEVEARACTRRCLSSASFTGRIIWAISAGAKCPRGESIPPSRIRWEFSCASGWKASTAIITRLASWAGVRGTKRGAKAATACAT